MATRPEMDMMGQALGTIAGNGEEAAAWVTARLAGAALRTVRSFDLRSARATGTECTCPSHGTAACDCQMVVLLVYGGQQRPATVVLHGHEGRTWLTLAETGGDGLAARIVAALAPARAAS